MRVHHRAKDCGRWRSIVDLISKKQDSLYELRMKCKYQRDFHINYYTYCKYKSNVRHFTLVQRLSTIEISRIFALTISELRVRQAKLLKSHVCASKHRLGQNKNFDGVCE